MEFDAYALLVDLGFISLLLLVGMLVRAKIGLWQMLLVPASITAGLLGLALGPNAAGLIPFSDQIAEYPTVLIAVIFASIPLAQSFELRGIAQRAGALWSYSMAMYILQWGLGLLFALTVLGLFFDLPDGFGLMLAAGWAGGFGTAAAVGAAYQGLGWNEATTLGFTSATVGVAVCIVGGLALTKWGTKTGKTGILGDAGQLPEELRTGLVSREEDRENIGKATISPASIEPLAFSLCLVLAATMGGYYLAILGGTLLSGIEIPSFATAFVVGLALRTVLTRTGAGHYVDRATLRGIYGATTDLLIAFGIASIVPSIVADYAVPLALLLLFGLAYCLLLFRYLTPRMFSEYWFEKGIFTWGWATASVATGIALLRIVDPKLESDTLEDFGVAYLGFAPVEIAVTTFAPFIVAFGFAWAFIGGSLLVGVGVIVLAGFMGWMVTGGGAPPGGDARRTPARSDRP